MHQIKCSKFVYVTIDVRTNELAKVTADKDMKKMNKAKDKIQETETQEKSIKVIKNKKI